MGALPDPAAAPNPRVAALVATYGEIARTRMADMPVSNPALHVEAVGFVADADDDGRVVAAGILIAPWFMNLVRLPLVADRCAQRVGVTRPRAFGSGTFEFIGAHEDALGAFEACSLFSPMFEFADQRAARNMAHAVLDELRRDDAASAPARPAEPMPPRRSFLFGRGAAHAGAR